MRKPFEGEYKQTQGFDDECCRSAYAKFGLKGHNGLDFACPTGTKILAPHDGKIIEATLDPAGYGIYVKIENSVEGSVLAHLREYRVGVGDGVKEGDLVGYSDNSGNSTGAHLHWGYYRFPRDRKNGFAGFIDQTPYITSASTVAVEKAVFEELVRKSTIYDNVIQKLKVADQDTVVYAAIEMLLTYEDALLKKVKIIIAKDQQIEEVKKEAERLQERVVVLQKENVEMQEKLIKSQDDLTKTQKDLAEQSTVAQKQAVAITELSNQLKELQAIQPVVKPNWIMRIIEAVKAWRK